jgi:hypothetical protein
MCGVEKKVTEFYTNYAKCKSCRYEMTKAYRASEAGKKARQKEAISARICGKKKQRQKKYDATEKGIATRKKYEDKRYLLPEGKLRLAAKNAVRYALRTGKIMKLPCFVCGDLLVEAHHPSYAEDMRLSVVWLCSVHHNQIHNPT